MENITQQKIEEQKESIRKNQENIANAREILEALGKWDNKNVDKRFFETFFNVKGEYREWTKFNLNKSRYAFQKSLELYISNSEYIEVESRAVSHIQSTLKKYIEVREAWNKEYIEKLKALEAVDEQKVVNELLEVYERNKIPENLWRKLLDSYEVKYPKE